MSWVSPVRDPDCFVLKRIDSRVISINLRKCMSGKRGG
jgi:hypothetical protein